MWLFCVWPVHIHPSPFILRVIREGASNVCIAKEMEGWENRVLSPLRKIPVTNTHSVPMMVSCLGHVRRAADILKFIVLFIHCLH